MVRYVRDNFFRPLSTKLAALGQQLDTATANQDVMIWLETVAHQRIHDTTKQKPAERLAQERPHLQSLPPELIPVVPVLPNNLFVTSAHLMSKQSLHHELTVYDQLTEGV